MVYPPLGGIAAAIASFDGCSATRANRISGRFLVKKFVLYMRVAAMDDTPSFPLSLQFFSMAFLHLSSITANYMPLIIQPVNSVKELKSSSYLLRCLAKYATRVSADMCSSNRSALLAAL